MSSSRPSRSGSCARLGCGGGGGLREGSGVLPILGCSLGRGGCSARRHPEAPFIPCGEAGQPRPRPLVAVSGWGRGRNSPPRPPGPSPPPPPALRSLPADVSAGNPRPAPRPGRWEEKGRPGRAGGERPRERSPARARPGMPRPFLSALPS